jgi:DNA-binding transcriptional MerR regulator
MYKIGEFSKLTKITVKMLRHYDQIGLLKPSYIDGWTNYRYYKFNQLPIAYKIVVLKDLGLSLDEIKNIIKREHDINPIIEKLNQKTDQVNREIKLLHTKLGKIKSYIKILKEDTNMKYDVIIKSVPEVIVASLRKKIKGYEEFNTLYPMMGEYMKEQKLTCLEPEYCFTIYHEKEYKPTDIDVEICQAVTFPGKDSELVKFKKITGYDTVASTMHKGPYTTIGSAYNAVFTWIKENGYEIIDNAREVYYDGI